MREIKFRAWDNFSKKMVYHGFSIPNNGWIQIKDDENFDLELMQFTGFKDKERKEIYEGDMFNIEDQNLPIKLPKSEKGIYAVVIWDEEWGCWNLKVKEKGDFNFHFARKNLLVRGNIYENSDLLS